MSVFCLKTIKTNQEQSLGTWKVQTDLETQEYSNKGAYIFNTSRDQLFRFFSFWNDY